MVQFLIICKMISPLVKITVQWLKNPWPIVWFDKVFWRRKIVRGWQWNFKGRRYLESWHMYQFKVFCTYHLLFYNISILYECEQLIKFYCQTCIFTHSSTGLAENWWKVEILPIVYFFYLYIIFASSFIFFMNVNYSSIIVTPVLSPTLQPDWPKTGETFCPAGTGWPSWQRCWTILRPAEEAEVGQDRKGLGRTDDIPEELCPRRWALEMLS